MYFAIQRDGSRTAKSIAIGALWRASAAPAARWCSARCCILARSTTASARRGAGSIEAFDEDGPTSPQLALFPAERAVPDHAKAYGVQVRLDAMAVASAAAMGRLLVGVSSLWATRNSIFSLRPGDSKNRNNDRDLRITSPRPMSGCKKAYWHSIRRRRCRSSPRRRYSRRANPKTHAARYWISLRRYMVTLKDKKSGNFQHQA